MELYFTIRATRLRTANPTQLGDIDGIMRARAGGCMQDGGFDLPKDQRRYAAKNFHRMDVSRNISASVELTYPNPSLLLINFFGREGNINLT